MQTNNYKHNDICGSIILFVLFTHKHQYFGIPLVFNNKTQDDIITIIENILKKHKIFMNIVYNKKQMKMKYLLSMRVYRDLITHEILLSDVKEGKSQMDVFNVNEAANYIDTRIASLLLNFRKRNSLRRI